ncbi:uncharacterized protein K02A2.6-like [Cotesia glomerata]|uniref:uncharacterized protein K02A2.6-like n=1 Tax=Cotesia glomerata TaxID=32391 RepID=UPI001D00E4C6|nr:uncharacterized protein K02A2.6-like [Cotesia glomerata]
MKYPHLYPGFCIKNDNLYRHVHHSLNYSERSDAWKLCVPESKRTQVIKENHDEPTAGHLGVTKTITRIARNYYWPRMHQDIARYVRNCKNCQEFKPQHHPTPGKMGTVNATRPWEVVSIDLIGPKPRSSNGICYVLVIQDKFTKWVEIQPLRQAKAEAIVRILKERVLLRFGSVRVVISDNGSQFISKEFTSLLKEYGIEHMRTPPYSPQCNPVERMNKVIGTMIAQFIKKSQRSWDKYLPELNFAINTSKHESTQFTPAYLNYGREILPPNTLRATCEGGQVVEDYNHLDSLQILKEAMDLVRLNLAKAFTKQSQHYNDRHIDWYPKIGDLVARREHHLSSAIDHFSGKLAEKYSGGYTVTKLISPNVFEYYKQSMKEESFEDVINSLQTVLGVEGKMNVEQLTGKVQARIKASKAKRRVRVKSKEKKKEKEIEEGPAKTPTTPEERLALIRERAIKRKRLEDTLNMDLDDVVVPPKKPAPASKKSAVPPTIDHHHRGGWQAEQPTVKPKSRRPAVFLKQSAPASGRTTKVLDIPIAPREVRRLAIRSVKEQVKTKITMIVPATSTSEEIAPEPVQVPPSHPIKTPQQSTSQPSTSTLEYIPTPIQQLQSAPPNPRPEVPLGPTLTLRPRQHYKKCKKKRYLEQGEDGKMYQVEERGGRVIRTETSKKIPSVIKLMEVDQIPTSTT